MLLCTLYIWSHYGQTARLIREVKICAAADALDSQEQTGALLPGRPHVVLNSEDQQAAGSHDYYGES